MGEQGKYITQDEPEEWTKILSVIPKSLHKRAKKLAIDQDRPLSSVVQELLEEWLRRNGEEVKR